MWKFFSTSLLWPLHSKPLETKGLMLGTAGASKIPLCLSPAVLTSLSPVEAGCKESARCSGSTWHGIRV